MLFRIPKCSKDPSHNTSSLTDIPVHGSRVGLLDGPKVGDTVGKLGDNDGEILGCEDGESLGDVDGEFVVFVGANHRGKICCMGHGFKDIL